MAAPLKRVRKNGKPRVLLVFGTRPEAIKMAPILPALRARGFAPRVCVTAQHRRMLDQVLRLFRIRPDHDLKLMRPDQSLEGLAASAIPALCKVMDAERPDLVLVQGDTTTTYCAALAAYYRKIPVGHVEAGLRTHDKFNPYPEEVNRRITAVIADWHFPPTEESRRNLLHEGVDPARIFVTGNTVIDALQLCLADRPALPAGVRALPLDARVILVTSHRRENFGGPLETLCAALLQISRRFPDVQIVYPVHLNPAVLGPVRKALGNSPRVHLLEPLEYAPFVALMNRSTLILTDSGGVQEEAPSLGKPVLVLRNVTERPEAVRAGAVRVVGTTTGRVVSEASRLLRDTRAYASMSRAINPYGDGRAAERIAQAVAHLFDRKVARPASFRAGHSKRRR